MYSEFKREEKPENFTINIIKIIKNIKVNIRKIIKKAIPVNVLKISVLNKLIYASRIKYQAKISAWSDIEEHWA